MEDCGVIDTALATTAEEREAVFRSGTRVYVEEMDRYRGEADHTRRMLRGPEDERSLIFYATDGHEGGRGLPMELGS